MRFGLKMAYFRKPCFFIYFSTCYFMFEHELIKCFLVSSKVEIKTQILTLVTSKSVHPNPNDSKKLLPLNFRNSTHKKMFPKRKCFVLQANAYFFLCVELRKFSSKRFLLLFGFGWTDFELKKHFINSCSNMKKHSFFKLAILGQNLIPQKSYLYP